MLVHVLLSHHAEQHNTKDVHQQLLSQYIHTAS